MKKLIYLALFLLVTTSCKDFLQEDPASLMVDSNFYKTEADADAAIVAVYDGLNDQSNIFYRGIYLLAELPTDNAECGQGVANANIFALKNFTYGPVNDRIYVLYTAVYKTIANANIAIDKIPAIPIADAKKNRLLAEAKFVRALLYFNMVQLFGDVPLVLNQVTSLGDVNVPRTAAAKVYEQIVADLEFAEQNLDATNATGNVGRATKASATGLLAKVYLTLKDYPKARDKAKAVIDNAQFGLVDSYFDVFTPQNRFNKEIIFSIQNKGNTGASNGFAMALFLPRSTIPLPGGGTVAGNSADVPTVEFYNSFKTGDLRKNRTFFTEYDAGAGKVTFRPHWYKFFDPSAIANLGEGTLNYPILRYSDMLLTYAEALNEIGGPSTESFEALNKVRRRAYGKPVATANATIDLQGLTKTSLLDAILDERRWEFGFENQRWFDLLRTGKLISTLQAKGITAIKNYNLLFPLPQRELDVNKSLTQNPGYTN
ncbi:RagB/SusD family nutrient uptake outer membrane protein [Dyadobacter frigoris]|uniref:RagB/SusD family nutrient uptake outer membrane protein n=1 Tax=Dyadobacter frigoris TaxID=2576211 RepID=A0A4U6CQH9_9BACT|nr:RagB/SusD family nutrient uptake outer membrane protein [Dyadobacter frigoris]TKT85701.1 RagB/SusD family nutrient uptake outer membrane protein [Dyadobacter frigoris]